MMMHRRRQRLMMALRVLSSRPPQRRPPRGGADRGPPRTTGLEAPKGSVVWDGEIKDPRALSLGYIPNSTKWELFKLHRSDPAEWTFERLATKFEMTQDRVRAIIVLKAREQEMRDNGEELPGEGLTKHFEAAYDNFLREVGQQYNVTLQNKLKREPHDQKTKQTVVFKRELADGEDEQTYIDYVRALEAESNDDDKDDKEDDDDKKSVEAKEQQSLRGERRRAPTKDEATTTTTTKKKKPNKGHLFAIKDLSQADAPTRIVGVENDVRLATTLEDRSRSWSPRTPYVETLPYAEGLAKDPLPGDPPPASSPPSVEEPYGDIPAAAAADALETDEETLAAADTLETDEETLAAGENEEPLAGDENEEPLADDEPSSVEEPLAGDEPSSVEEQPSAAADEEAPPKPPATSDGALNLFAEATKMQEKPPDDDAKAS